MTVAIAPYIKLMRPLQWVKAAFVIAPVFFALKWHDLDAWVNILLAAIAFTASASAIYILNDWVDVESDKVHPKKSTRPLAAGTASIKVAGVQAVGLLSLSAYICTQYLPMQTMAMIGFYIFLNFAYSLFFKKIPVIDVVVLACFYILRVLMGCLAIDVPATSWIILTTFFLALTIGFAKRHGELQLVGFETNKENLKGYNLSLITCLLGICTAGSVITYAIYAVEKQHQIGSESLVYSVIFVVAAFFRFLYLALVEHAGDEPERVILHDKPLIILCLSWLASAMWALHG